MAGFRCTKCDMILTHERLRGYVCPRGCLQDLPQLAFADRVEVAARRVYAEWDRLKGTRDTNSLELHEAMEALGRLLCANVR